MFLWVSSFFFSSKTFRPAHFIADAIFTFYLFAVNGPINFSGNEGVVPLKENITTWTFLSTPQHLVFSQSCQLWIRDNVIVLFGCLACPAEYWAVLPDTRIFVYWDKWYMDTNWCGGRLKNCSLRLQALMPGICEYCLIWRKSLCRCD